jgi:hypothetical protein
MELGAFGDDKKVRLTFVPVQRRIPTFDNDGTLSARPARMGSGPQIVCRQVRQRLKRRCRERLGRREHERRLENDFSSCRQVVGFISNDKEQINELP